ncbi:hypothetical protein BVY04_05135 [bacterium M21]|nr:hypothetical protein BVY04_05135 [bacterium M21]
MSWYYHAAEKNVGPLTAEEFQTAISDGKIEADTLVWQEDMPEWVTFDKLPPENHPSPAAGEEPSTSTQERKCIECGNEFPENVLINYGNDFVCGGCKEHFFQRVREGAAMPNNRQDEGTNGTTPNRDLNARAWQNLSADLGLPIGICMLAFVITQSCSVVPYLGVLILLLVLMPLHVGRSKFFLKYVRDEEREIGVLFEGFSQYWACLGAAILRGLMVYLPIIVTMIPMMTVLIIKTSQNQGQPLPQSSTILIGSLAVLLIPGSIISYFLMYTYFLTDWVIADNPEIGPIQALKKCKEMMIGKRWKLFCLHCRFIGWALLATLPCLLGYILLAPYFQVANTHFYIDAKDPDNAE